MARGALDSGTSRNTGPNGGRNGIAAICLAMRDEFGLIPHIYFDWTEGSPLIHFLRFILWGSGEVAPVSREILRRAEPDRSRRPHVHAG